MVVFDDEVGEFMERGLPVLATTKRDPMIFPGCLGIKTRDGSLGVMMESDLV
jgi:hypothetical protein